MIRMTTTIATPSPAIGPVCDLEDAAWTLAPTVAPDPAEAAVPIAAVVAEPSADAISGLVVSAGADASKALSGSTIPKPYRSLCCPVTCPFPGSAEAIRSRITCPAVHDRCAERISAAVAETYAVEADVPVVVPELPKLSSLGTSTPGAANVT